MLEKKNKKEKEKLRKKIFMVYVILFLYELNVAASVGKFETFRSQPTHTDSTVVEDVELLKN